MSSIIDRMYHHLIWEVVSYFCERAVTVSSIIDRMYHHLIWEVVSYFCERAVTVSSIIDRMYHHLIWEVVSYFCERAVTVSSIIDRMYHHLIWEVVSYFWIGIMHALSCTCSSANNLSTNGCLGVPWVISCILCCGSMTSRTSPTLHLKGVPLPI